MSALLQDGAFTTVSDKLTIYIGSRNERGEVVGLLINDDRDPQQPVTILAERGAFADADRAQGSRIIMVNGSRQRFDRATGKLSVLTFERYTLDLDMLRDAPVVSLPRRTGALPLPNCSGRRRIWTRCPERVSAAKRTSASWCRFRSSALS